MRRCDRGGCFEADTHYLKKFRMAFCDKHYREARDRPDCDNGCVVDSVREVEQGKWLCHICRGVGIDPSPLYGGR